MVDSSKKESNGHQTDIKAKESPTEYGRIILTLKNCVFVEEKPTPSAIDGLDAETEADLRNIGCELIQTAGILLKMPQVAMATAQVLFQRFYYSKSFVRQNFEITGMGCLLLASKIEESPRRVRDIINVYHHIKQVNSQKSLSPMILDQTYLSLKYQVIKAERRVLKELGFCVHVQHPHKLIVLYLQVLGLESRTNLMQLAWNYMNDSLRTDVFVRYQPETVACACIYLTARKLKIPLPRSPSWFSAFNVSEEDIQDISMKILKLYTRSKPKAEELEKKVDELCKKFEETRLRNKAVNSMASGTNTPNSQTPDKKTSPKRTHSDRSGSESPRHKRYKRSRSRSYDRYKKSRSRRSRSSSQSKNRDKRYRSRSRSYERSYHKDGKYVADSYKEKYSRRDDDRYRRDDDDYRYKSRDDDRYSKEHRRDDDKYRKDDDKYRKDDDRHRKDETKDVKSRKEEDGKVRKEEEKRQEIEEMEVENSKPVKKSDDGHKHKKEKVARDEDGKKVKSKHTGTKHKSSSSEKKKRKKHYDDVVEDDEIEIIHVKKEKKSR